MGEGGGKKKHMTSHEERKNFYRQTFKFQVSPYVCNFVPNFVTELKKKKEKEEERIAQTQHNNLKSRRVVLLVKITRREYRITDQQIWLLLSALSWGQG